MKNCNLTKVLGWFLSLTIAIISYAQEFDVSEISVRSDEIFIDFEPEKSSFWHTATNNVMILPISFPEGATSAELSISGIGYRKVYRNITSDSVEVILPKATSPSTENVYEFNLEFDNGVTSSVRLGLIQGYGADGCGSTRCIAAKSSRKWPQVEGKAVLPIPYGMRSFTLDGVEVETGLGGAQGWYALGPVDTEESVTAELTTEKGDIWTAFLFGKFPGFYMFVR